MANFLAALFGGTKHDKDMKRLQPLVDKVKAEYSWAESLRDEDFPRLTAEWKEEVQSGKKTLDDLLPKAFALAREAAGRTFSLGTGESSRTSIPDGTTSWAACMTS